MIPCPATYATLESADTTTEVMPWILVAIVSLAQNHRCATSPLRCNLVAMPELPDISAYIKALEARILGQRLERVRIASVFLLRTVDPPLESAEGRTVTAIRRIGKRIAIGLDGNPELQKQTLITETSGPPSQQQGHVIGEPERIWLVVHLMIAGRLHWKAAGAKVAERNALAAFDFPTGTLTLTEAGSKRRASLHVVRGEEGLENIDPGGVEVFETDLAGFRAALGAENRTLKRALTDPRLISGVGNAYSDEILHAAKLSPVTLTSRLSDGDWDRLFTATRETLAAWMERLGKEAEAGFPEGVTAFRPEMAVHGRYGKPCPRCGSPVQRIRYADNETNYCATCQTGGKVLADRSLSRLLGADWPRTLDELEALKRR
jgi:formamidopyrimidine-DNA glycosylase